MKPTDELKAEHDGIVLLLDVLERISDRIMSGEKVPAQHLGQVLEFLRVFVDKCHHGKEEDILFPAMMEQGISDAGVQIEVLLAEHDRGRKLTGEMAALLQSHENRDPGALSVFTTPVLQYINLMRSHIWKENAVLFAMADQIVPPEKQERILRDFELLEQERIGAGRHEAFHAMLKTLSGFYL